MSRIGSTITTFMGIQAKVLDRGMMHGTIMCLVVDSEGRKWWTRDPNAAQPLDTPDFLGMFHDACDRKGDEPDT